MTWVVLIIGIVAILAVDQVLRRRRRARPQALASAPPPPRGANPGESPRFNDLDGGA
ncbi:MAG: hypothetical protein AAGD33_05925 [Actinomycetota bacterium]